jgi:ComF family protein
MSAAALFRLLCPPACVACRRPCDGQAPLCRNCVRELNFEFPVWGNPPPGARNVVSSFRHEGAARELLQAFKFGRMSGLASLMAGYMAEHLGDLLGEATVIAVPPSRIRARLRGFDPAGLLATEVCRIASAPPPENGVIGRDGHGRQRGRGRQQRLAAPPVIRPLGPVAGPVVLIDDVITTGATITACSSALERCGAGEITALSFSRRV